jgi:transposase
MSQDMPPPDSSIRQLRVTVEPAAGTVVVPSDDPQAAAVQVPVIRIPASEIGAERAATSPSPGPTTVEESPLLPDDPAVLKRMILELLDALKKEQHEREGLQQRLDLLLRRLYGPKAERFDPNQPWLPGVAAQAADPAVAEPSANEPQADEAADKPKRKGHGRKPLPRDLPRRRVEHTLPEAQRLCPCCGIACPKFAEDVSEQLDYQPASLFVWQHVRFKYACQSCHDHVRVAPTPVAIIDKGIPGPGLLAQIAASKYADHLPLHRLERILSRHGVDLARSTMCDWMAHVANLFRPVTALMATLVRQSRALHTDATKMPFLDPLVPGKTLSGQMWVYFGDRDHPFNVFDFCRNHTAVGIDTFVKNNHYRGYLNADALNLYDHLFVGGEIVEVGCWAHCRRNFYDARESDPARATFVMARIRQLYEVEAEARKTIAAAEMAFDAADAVRLRLRQEKSLAIVTALQQWLEGEQAKVLPKSLIGQAIAYARRHWTALTRFLGDGFLAIDNNVAEQALRQIALGRKNWLFAGSARGAETAAILFTMTSSCHRHGIDAFAYLRDLLERLAHDPKPAPENLRAWLPDRWRAPVAESPDTT